MTGSTRWLGEALYHMPRDWVLLAATDGARFFGYWCDVMNDIPTLDDVALLREQPRRSGVTRA